MLQNEASPQPQYAITSEEKGARTTRLQVTTSREESLRQQQLDHKIDAAIEKALQAPILAADPAPGQRSQLEPSPHCTDAVIHVGDLVVVRLDSIWRMPVSST